MKNILFLIALLIFNIVLSQNDSKAENLLNKVSEKIDNATVVKYVDRFLMYYIKTALPLQRTAAWLDKLEGGIEYLKDIVVKYSLGICEDLDKEMQGLVNTYKCEWKEAIENIEIQNRYSHFVNSEEIDSNLNFVPLRDQKMPELWES